MEKLLGRKEILRLVPYSSRHLYRLEAAGLFPKHVTIGRKSMWLQSKIDTWLGSLKHADGKE